MNNKLKLLNIRTQLDPELRNAQIVEHGGDPGSEGNVEDEGQLVTGGSSSVGLSQEDLVRRDS